MTARLRLDDNGKIIFYDAWKNITASELRSCDFIPLLEQDLGSANLSIHDVNKYIWVIDLKPEGISADDISGLYDFICNVCGTPSSNFRVVFSCQEKIDLLPYPSICLPDRLIYNGNWFMHMEHYRINWANMPMTHDLVCLMRRPSIGRANLVNRLLKKFNRDSVIMTFGTNGSESSDDIRRLINPQPYPIIVDRPMADRVFQHRIDHDFFYRAPVNLVVESSSQIDPNTWRSIFVTEKTFKALAWHQFPIWYAVPGLVSEVRKMGFDLFDDLLDGHRYDHTEDPWVRMTQVVMLTKKFCEQDPVAMRSRYWERLQNNAFLIKKIHDTAISRHTEALNGLIYR